jgi:hypothetical protein
MHYSGIFGFVIALVLFSGSSQNASLPPKLRQCVTQITEIRIDWLQKPIYLKVFFTPSKAAAYVIAVKDGTVNRALVCASDGKATLLGTKQYPFSTMTDDNYMSSKWRVCKKAEVKAMKKYYAGVPDPANESICFLWEDGEALIYSDGQTLRWKSFAP